MYWRKRLVHRVYVSVSGFLLALFFLEAAGFLFHPNFFPLHPSTAEAATAVIDPDGNGTTGGTATTCTSSLHFECLNDAVRSPSLPSTAGDYIQFNNGAQNYSTMGTIANVSSATSIAVSVYHLEGSATMATYVSLWNAAEGTQFGTEIQLTNRTAASWDTATFNGLTLTQTDLDGLRVRVRCSRPGGGSPSTCRTHALYATVTYTPGVNVTVSSSGSQQNASIPATNAYLGGTFRIVENTSSRSITSITIAENGTVDAASHLKNIRLRYDLDTSTPYDCASESYAGTETQYGSTDADGFSGADGTSVFSGSVTITTTQSLCVYVVADVQSGASSGQTVELQITDPSTQVVGSGSAVVSPATAVALAGTTNLTRAELTQTGYHWRSDDGNEAAATSVTGGSENTPFTNMSEASPYRLRIAVSNAGGATSASTPYRLEYATKVTTCDIATGWTDVASVGGDFDMFDSSFITDGSNTSNISVPSGGITDPNTTFLTPNGGLRDTTSQTGGITLSSTQFVELEYALRANAGATTEGTSYCFRVSNAGTSLFAYTQYPEATIAADVLVTTEGSVASTRLIPSTNAGAGGAFVIKGVSAGSKTVTGITLTAGGTADLSNDIANVKLRYDLDTSAPYDCVSASYANTDTQLGSTVTSLSLGKATFTGSFTVSPVQTACVYIEYDVISSATNGATLSFSIADASTDVVSSSSVAPIAAVSLQGTTVLAKQEITQNGYHWRNNDGTESAASSATGGNQNTPLNDAAKESTYRLRMGISNEGFATSSAMAYRLEWGQKVSTCDAVSSWTRVDATQDAWQMSPNGNLTDGNNTTNISTALGGINDQNPDFVGTNGAVKDTNDTVSSLTLSPAQFFEAEYSIQPTQDAVQGGTYCFRLSDSGTALDTYGNYPEITIKLDTDFKVQRGVSIMTGDTLTITAGTEYEAPASSANAFIRITNTQLTGAGPDTGGGNNNASDVTAYITNPENITSSITFQRGPFSSSNTRIYWEIIEYRGAPGGENEFIVRKQEALSYVSGNASVTSGAISGIVDDADVAVFITGQHNQDAGRNSYNAGLSVASWGNSTDQVTLTRGSTGTANDTSYAAVEFTGDNWRVQRIEHTYSAVGSTETESMTSVNSLSRTFVHAQKMTTSNTHADFGHEVWLSGIGQVSFSLDTQAVTPSGHTSVAWVIENMQTNGVMMKVARSNGTLPLSATSPQSNSISIGTTLDDLSTASIFTTSESDTTSRSWPEPILGVRIASTTHYELWRSDAAANVLYRTEVVEWPTAARKLTQNYYRLYANNDALTPTDPWPSGLADLGENTEITVNDTPVGFGDIVRLRMTVTVTGAVQSQNLDAYKLQYGERVTTCSAVASWNDLGESESSTALWKGASLPVNDGTALSSDPPGNGDLLISVSTVAGTYEEENNSALNPYTAMPGDEVEYDWAIMHNGAADKTSYCFRMVEAGGASFESYQQYPTIRTAGYGPVMEDWRFYDDETNLTPTQSLASENVAPTDVGNANIIKLRAVLTETTGANGNNVKFKVQFSEHADFSSVTDVVATSSCTDNSLWCYADGAGTDNGVVDATVLALTDACTNGSGPGCGTYNESGASTTATYDHQAFSSAEFEFTLKQAGARANAVYYFRLYDVVNAAVVQASSSYPSLVSEGAHLVFDVAGLQAGTITEGEVLDATSTPGSIVFGSVPFNDPYTAGYRLSIDTNATEGFQIFMYTDQPMQNETGATITPVVGNNAAPQSWESGCSAFASSCFGYHAGDDTLQGGSARFAPNDTYAALSTEPDEVIYSSIPGENTHDILYKLRVTEEQPAGIYEASINFLAIPIF